MNASAFRAVLFDMDGLLVDSEPLWQRAEMEVFGAAGLALGPADCRRTTGLRIDEVVAFWRAARPAWAPPEDGAALTERIVDRVISLVEAEGALCPGAREAVAFFAAAGLPLGLASSSPLRLIEAVLARFSLRGAFQAVQSAQHEPLGKPHPAVYLRAAALLQAPPSACLALEDSPSGVIAAKAARMTCIAVPTPEDRTNRRVLAADLVLGSLEEIGEALWARLDVS